MANFVLAIVNIIYALVCLTNDTDQEMFSMSKPAEDSFEEGAEGK